MNMKICNGCLLCKPITDFQNSKTCADGVRQKCRACVNIKRRSWGKANSHKKRLTHIKSLYGIDKDTYESLLITQNYRCAFCKQEETQIFKGKIKRLSIDHCHNSSQVRWLLCASCNSMIGYAKDNPELLRTAANKLEEFQQKTQDT